MRTLRIVNLLLLASIATAQAQAKATRGSYGDFNTLVQSGFLDQRFAGETPVLRGYKFRMTAGVSVGLAQALRRKLMAKVVPVAAVVSAAGSAI